MALVLQNFRLTDSTARPAKQPLMSAKMGVRFRVGAFPVPQPAHGLTVKIKFISSFWTRFAPEELGTEWNRGGHGAPPVCATLYGHGGESTKNSGAETQVLEIYAPGTNSLTMKKLIAATTAEAGMVRIHAQTMR